MNPYSDQFEYVVATVRLLEPAPSSTNHVAPPFVDQTNVQHDDGVHLDPQLTVPDPPDASLDLTTPHDVAAAAAAVAQGLVPPAPASGYDPQWMHQPQPVSQSSTIALDV